MNSIEKKYTLREIYALVAKDIKLPAEGYESAIEYDKVGEIFTFKIIRRPSKHRSKGKEYKK